MDYLHCSRFSTIILFILRKFDLVQSFFSAEVKPYPSYTHMKRAAGTPEKVEAAAHVYLIIAA